ncbi:hypothetical protein PINS_up009244 [Pythium insidiosum]|nr:hypothetical protein PINS_up009244 [Pythium insidiosum]
MTSRRSRQALEHASMALPRRSLRRRVSRSGGGARTAAPAPINALPDALLRRVLLFALRSTPDRLVPSPGRLRSDDKRLLSAVHPRWRRVMQEIDAETTSRAVELDVYGDIERQLQCALEKRKGRSVLDLRLTAEAEESMGKLAVAVVDWRSLFRKLPRVERLDLSQLTLRSEHLIAILDAAGELCPGVEALIFADCEESQEALDGDEEEEEAEEEEEEDEDHEEDQSEDEQDDSDEEDESVSDDGDGDGGDDGVDREDNDDDDDDEGHVNDPIVTSYGVPQILDIRDSKPLFGYDVDPVFDALYRAIKRWYQANGSGLRQLRIQERRHADYEQANADFLSVLTTHCPRIEYVDGWKGSYSQYKFAICYDQWATSLDAWNAFCETCVELREFSWIVVPFTNAYLVPFGATPKPRLRKLRIEFSSAAPFRVRDGEYSQAGLLAMLQGLPALEDLVFEFQHNLQYEVNAEALLTDSFFVELSRCCPRLRRVSINDTPFASSIKQFGGISDASLLALASVPSMAKFSCTVPLDMSVSALLTYLLGGSGSDSRFREAAIDAMIEHRPDPLFPSLVLTELKSKRWSAELRRGRGFALVLYDAGVAPLSRIKRLARDFRNVDPRLQTIVKGYREETCTDIRVTSCLLCTSDAPLSMQWRREFRTDDGGSVILE